MPLTNLCHRLVRGFLTRRISPVYITLRGKEISTWDWAEETDKENGITVFIYTASNDHSVVVETAKSSRPETPLPDTLQGWKTKRGVWRGRWTIPQQAWLGDGEKLAEVLGNILRRSIDTIPPMNISESPSCCAPTPPEKTPGFRKLDLD